MAHWIVVNRHSLSLRDYPAYFGAGFELTLVTSQNVVVEARRNPAEPLLSYQRVVIVADFDNNFDVTDACIRVAEEHPVDGILPISELDLLRGEQIASLLGCAIPTGGNSAAFRDKLAMKIALRDGKIPVAPWFPVRTAADLLRAADELGFPLVVKPRFGSGSVDVNVLSDMEELRRYGSNSSSLREDGYAELLAERFIYGQLFHVDGLVVQGQLSFSWPSRIGRENVGCLSHVQGESLSSVMLSESDPLWTQLNAFTQEGISALPVPTTYLFHAEIFHANDRFVFNEVGLRQGGIYIESMLKASQGIDLIQEYVRSLMGNSHTPHAANTASPQLRLGGGIAFASQGGVVERAPQKCDVPGVVHFSIKVRSGDLITESDGSSDAIALATVVGNTSAEVESALVRAERWFLDQFRLTKA